MSVALDLAVTLALLWWPVTAFIAAIFFLNVAVTIRDNRDLNAKRVAYRAERCRVLGFNPWKGRK